MKKTREKTMKLMMVSTFPPRECGLATFSADMARAIEAVFGHTLPVEICALQNDDHALPYDDVVKQVLNARRLEDYREQAERINLREDIGVVCIQHEFGLFGGVHGDYLLSFMLALNKPIVTVLHTALPFPDEKRRKVVEAIADLSAKVVVLTQRSRELLCVHYGSSEHKVSVIPHGTHIVPWDRKEGLKQTTGLAGRFVLSTFGLISENKSIETVLKSLPEVVSRHPEVLYLVIGKTHPEVLRREGERYRGTLENLVRELGLEDHVLFVNEYLELDRLLDYLSLSDIYLFASRDPAQAVSGTFAYAMSCGCPIISTPIPHAVENLQGSGILLESFGNPQQFRDAILRLISEEELRLSMGRNAYALTHATAWQNIAIRYGLLYGELTNKTEDLRFMLPPLKLEHIKAMTTETGILQFSKFSRPDPASGYTLDDNARALINMIMFEQLVPGEGALQLAETYLSFVARMQRPDGWFDNYLSYGGLVTAQNERENLDDANGRALWSLGFVAAQGQLVPLRMVERAGACLEKAMQNLDRITSPRAMAYAIKGLYHYHNVHRDVLSGQWVERYADRLLHHCHVNSEEGWRWYEDYMTYANSVLPGAMLYSYLITGHERFRDIAEVTFDFLLSQYFMKGQIQVISNNGWFKKKNEREFYGEQPIEVASTVIALDHFYEATGNPKYRHQLDVAFSWFLGNNHLRQIMYNPLNGASYDGLEHTHVNINQGAESTLCFLKARMIMEKYAGEDQAGNRVARLPARQLSVRAMGTADALKSALLF